MPPLQRQRQEEGVRRLQWLQPELNALKRQLPLLQPGACQAEAHRVPSGTNNQPLGREL